MCDDHVPLSVLSLDLGGVPPVEGWAIYLARRGLTLVPDCLGRDSVTAKDARILLDEHRQTELRKVKLRQVAEQEAVESDRQWRASLPRGVPWYEIPDGVAPATAMLAAAKAAQPRRRSVLEDSLSNSGTVFHPIQSSPDDEW